MAETSDTKKFAVGIDLGGTFIKFGLLSERLEPSETLQLPTPPSRQPMRIVEQMVAGARQVVKAHSLSSDDLLGVGIGSPGPLKIDEGIVVATPNLPGIENLPLRDLIAEKLSLPAVLENDANAAAYGEFLRGAGEGTRNMVMLTLGTGIGGGIIIDGKILHGSHDMAGEIGHVIVEPGGEQCGCGQRGCFERYCSATYIAQRAKRKISESGAGGRLVEMLAKKGDIDSRDIVQAARAGDELASEIWDEAMCYLAIGCVDICRLIDPDRIVLAGGMTKAGESLMKPLMKHFAHLHWKLTARLTEITIATLGNDAGVIGAAGVALSAFRA